MKVYFTLDKYGQKEQITEDEYLSLFGEKEYRLYAHKLYYGMISIEDIPEDKRDVVQNIVNNRIVKYGSYDSQPATLNDMNKAIQKLLGYKVTKGELKQLIPSLLFLRDNTNDAIASQAINIFPKLNGDGTLIKAGTRICWMNTIKRATVDLWDSVENHPDVAPQLWEDINYKNGYRIIPEVITVGSAFSIDEIGVWKDKLYQSLINANIYTPEQYPMGWKEIILEE